MYLIHFSHLPLEKKKSAMLCSVGGELVKDAGHVSQRGIISKHNDLGIVLATSVTFKHALFET